MIRKLILVILLLFVSNVSAYNIPVDKAPIGWHPSEFEVIKYALFEHDQGNTDIWVYSVIEDADWYYTRSGRGYDNHTELREYIIRIEARLSNPIYLPIDE